MQVNAEDTAQALRVLRAQDYRESVIGAEQMDIEEATGVSETQARREAEAGGIAADRLRSLVGRIERMHEEIKALQGNVAGIYKEAANMGFDAKALKALIRERAAREKNADAVEEQMHLLDLYRRAIGG
jgi:uncharacterized protein (UPF0335 family)